MVRSFSWPGLIDCKLIILIVNYGKFAAEYRFNRIIKKNLEYWADPGRTIANKINHNDGGRGCYFLDPDRHFLEIITRPYGKSD